jgi:putative NADH-flavin reductase
MRIAIIGASGKTGRQLVRQSLQRQWQVAAVCRDGSADRLSPYREDRRLSIFTAPVVSSRQLLAEALRGCDAVVGVSISVRRLKASELVDSLISTIATNSLRRVVLTAGEVTVDREPSERYTSRQWFLRAFVPPLLAVTPYSMTDMIHAGRLLRQSDLNWTIIRAPTLTDQPAGGYRFCELHEVTAKHALSRADYAAALLDVIDKPQHHRQTLTVIPGSR